jgi:prepilin-type processing-associated H-X9-DG protein
VISTDPLTGILTNYYENNTRVATTQFRFAGVADVAMLDGHVEANVAIKPVSVAPFNLATWNEAESQWNLGFLATDNLMCDGQPSRRPVNFCVLTEADRLILISGFSPRFRGLPWRKKSSRRNSSNSE